MKKLIRFLIFGYLLVFPFGQLVRLPFSSGSEVRVYLTDIFVLLMIVFWGIWRIKTRKENKERAALFWPILVFIGVAALSLLFNVSRLAGGETFVASLYLLRFIFYAGVYFVVFDLQVEQPRISHFLTLAGGLTACFGLLQYLWFPDLRVWLEAGNWDPHYYRAIGTFLDPGFLGMIMVLNLILLYRLVTGEKYFWRFGRPSQISSPQFCPQNSCGISGPSWAKKALYPVGRSLYGAKSESSKIWMGFPRQKLFRLSLILNTIVTYLCLMLTYSRSSYLAYLLGMAVIAWIKKAPRFFLAVLIIFTLTILVLPRPGGEGVKLERESTIQARIRNWRQSLTIAGDHPVFGVGFNAYRYAQRDYGFLGEEKWQQNHAGAGADSSLLFVLATTGIVGFAIYGWILKKVLSGTCGLAVFASMTALLGHSFFLNSLFYPWIMGWIFLLLGSFNKAKKKP